LVLGEHQPVKPRAFDGLDVLISLKIEERSPISSIAVGFSLDVICRDGSVYRACLVGCTKTSTAGKVPLLSNVRALAKDQSTGLVGVIDYRASSCGLQRIDFYQANSIRKNIS
jgi:hypothetical protein